MRHMKSGRKLGVSPSHREALLRQLTLALIERDSIETGVARAKEVRWYAERVVTLAKRGDANVAARRRIVQLLGSSQNTGGPNRVRTAIGKIYENLVPRFKTRPGGYTQILRLATNRAGDNSERCIIRYIPDVDESKAKKKADKKPQKPTKKVEAKHDHKHEDKKAHAKHDHDHGDKKPTEKKAAAKPEDKPAKKKSEKDK